MKVKSTTSISFPKLNWAISPGEEKELPENEEAQKRILSEADIKPVEENGEKKVISKIKNK